MDFQGKSKTILTGKPTQYSEQIEKIVSIVQSSKERTFRKVNEEMILMYWNVGEYISKLSKDAEYGDAFVQKLADFLRRTIRT